MNRNTEEIIQFVKLVHGAMQLEENGQVSLCIEDPHVGKSFEMYRLRARFLRTVAGEPTSSVIAFTSLHVLASDLREHRIVAQKMLEMLRSFTTDVRAGEMALNFDLQGRLQR
jgi:hypothetical protein